MQFSQRPGYQIWPTYDHCDYFGTLWTGSKTGCEAQDCLIPAMAPCVSATEKFKHCHNFRQRSQGLIFVFMQQVANTVKCGLMSILMSLKNRPKAWTDILCLPEQVWTSRRTIVTTVAIVVQTCSKINSSWYFRIASWLRAWPASKSCVEPAGQSRSGCGFLYRSRFCFVAAWNCRPHPETFQLLGVKSRELSESTHLEKPNQNPAFRRGN